MPRLRSSRKLVLAAHSRQAQDLELRIWDVISFDLGETKNTGVILTFSCLPPH